MRNRSLCRRLMALLLAAVMVLSLCACGSRRGEEEQKPTEAAEEAEQVRATVSAEEADAYMHNDPTVAKHIAHNKAVDPQPLVSREAAEFHMYVANTETMQGFVNPKRATAYQDGIQCAFDAAYNMFEDLYGHTMAPEGWTDTEVDDLLMRDILSPSFYNLALPVDGALAPLFRRTTPFAEDGLTVIVSNFVEPGYDVSFLSAGIQDYFDSYTKSSACLIGISSQFEGRFHVPQNYRSENRSTFYVDRFEGSVPYYLVVVGPEASVDDYTELLFKHLDNRKVEYAYEKYSNSVYEEKFANPLVFDLVPDQKLPKAVAPVLTSYNTGKLSEHAEGGAFFATYSSVETRDGRAEGEKSSRSSKKEETAPADNAGVKVSKSSQIALVSRNYDGMSVYDYDYYLYVYDKKEDKWLDAGKNAQLMATVVVEPQQGPFKDTLNKDYVILAENRDELYVSTRLDFGTDNILSRDEVYRLEVRLHLNQETWDTRSQAELTALAGWSINTDEYFGVMEDFCVLSNDNYAWTGTYQSVREVALEAFCRTPNLDALLLNLRNLEKRYETHTEMFTYLDFVFNIRDKDSRR